MITLITDRDIVLFLMSMIKAGIISVSLYAKRWIEDIMNMVVHGRIAQLSRVLAFCSLQKEPVTNGDVAEELNVTPDYAGRLMNSLVREGCMEVSSDKWDKCNANHNEYKVTKEIADGVIRNEKEMDKAVEEALFCVKKSGYCVKKGGPKRMSRTERIERIKDMMRADRHVTQQKIADTIGMSLRTIQYDIEWLEAHSEVCHRNSLNGGWWEVKV